MDEKRYYDDAVRAIKTAILQSQYHAASSVNKDQLLLYYSIGKYISLNSRRHFWGQGAIDAISQQLDKELPGLKGFSARNLRYMRTFYEEWQMLEPNDATPSSGETSNSEPVGANLAGKVSLEIWNPRVPKVQSFPFDAFFMISFTNHRIILTKAKSMEERLFYIQKCAAEKMNKETLLSFIDQDAYHHQGQLPNNFIHTLSTSQQALHAITTFKDEYLLDFINVEELDVRDRMDLDEKVVENAIVHNIKNFILTFGKDFAFIRNQYHLEAFGEDGYIDLLFFNRDLNCLVAIELKRGQFKTSYLGQLSGYLSILDRFEKKPHENPAIGIILCKDMNKAFVDFVIRDYSKPMGVATYKTSKDMSDELKQKLPDMEDLKHLLESEESFS